MEKLTKYQFIAGEFQCTMDATTGYYYLGSDVDRRIAALECIIDNLMLEYCPDEMTREQWDNWAAHQIQTK